MYKVKNLRKTKIAT